MELECEVFLTPPHGALDMSSFTSVQDGSALEVGAGQGVLVSQ